MRTPSLSRWWRRPALIVAASLTFGLGHAATAAAAPAGQPPEPPVAAAGSKVDPALRSLTGTGSFWAVLDEADLSGAAGQHGKEAKGRFVVRAKREHATERQAELRGLLDARKAHYRSYWAVDAVQITGDARLLAEVAARPEVTRIVPARSLPLVGSVPATGPAGAAAATADDGTEWGVAAINAPRVWEKYATRGEGITVASIDTGVDSQHPALAANYRGIAADGSRDDDYAWFDPTDTCQGGIPCDNNGHGTHTMGTMVGAGGIGVAPGAKWIAAKGCGASTCEDASLVAAGQWILAPTDREGRNPRPDLAPDIVNNSWGGGQQDFWYRPLVDAWIAAGIFPAFSAGNEGPRCDTLGSPGDYDESYAAAAFDADGKAASFSSRGAAGQDGKPDIAAPGVNIRSSLPGGEYGLLSGTSMASPHVAGAVALLWSAAPALYRDVPGTRRALDTAAVDVDDSSCGGTAADNRVWGEGRLDVLAAVDAAPRSATGSLAGAVTDQDGGAVAGATVTIAGPVTRTTQTGGDGRYTFARVPVGDYTVTVRAYGFLPGSRTVPVAADEDVTGNFRLDSAPVRKVTGTVRGNDGTLRSGAIVTALDTPAEHVRTDADGHYEIALPVGSYTLRVSGDGCWGSVGLPVTITDSDVTADAVLSAARDGYGYECRTEPANWLPGTTKLDSQHLTLPFPVPYYAASYFEADARTYGYLDFAGTRAWSANEPLPTGAEPSLSIYAFWDWLGRGNAVDRYTAVYGTAPDRVFVVEWRDALLTTDPEARVDAEMQIHENGDIVLAYHHIDPSSDVERGASATTGIEDKFDQNAVQYSYNKPVLSDDTAIRFHAVGYATLTGKVTDLGNGSSVQPQLSVQDDTGRTISVRGNIYGQYAARLPLGHYKVTVSWPGWESRTFEVSLTDEHHAYRHDVQLPSAKIALSPSTFTVVVPPGEKRNYRLTVSNTGTAATPVKVTETRSSTPPFTDIPWLSAQPVDDVPVGGSSTVDFTVDATDLAPGKHFASLYLTTPVSGRITGRAVGVTVAVPAYHAYVNAGGTATTDPAGDRWSADRPYSPGDFGYIGGEQIATGHAIAGADDQDLLRFAREGVSQYRFDDLPAGIYEVTVKLAEIRNHDPGERVFDVYAGDKPVALGVDLAQTPGRETAAGYTVFLKLADPQNDLDLRFVQHGGKHPPLVNAVRVVQRPDRFTA
ncbi:S8 family serine peptidase [Streptomyces sp. AcE210]|uniref:S8 family serine peptidase n=1 Tax=Streptomyces sp. AcE210 TaxID=2292703 RepID=UPI000E3031BC|nr:S8 family serine peptidase [Streptomyces sp. AcE210]RFC70300.1 peptidase [Streptomyces sp. AcE210]